MARRAIGERLCREQHRIGWALLARPFVALYALDGRVFARQREFRLCVIKTRRWRPAVDRVTRLALSADRVAVPVRVARDASLFQSDVCRVRKCRK